VFLWRNGHWATRLATVSGARRHSEAVSIRKGPRDFDPEAVGNAETDAWASYCRREWYELVAGHGDLRLDPVEASRREVEWWRRHREHQYGVIGDEEPLVDSLVDLYSYVYGVPGETVREAARQRVLAMRHSDAWVEAGCDLADPLLTQEREALLASYRALRVAVGH